MPQPRLSELILLFFCSFYILGAGIKTSQRSCSVPDEYRAEGYDTTSIPTSSKRLEFASTLLKSRMI